MPFITLFSFFLLLPQLLAPFLRHCTRAGTEDVKPDNFLKYENKLVARTKADPRLSSNNANNATTNILITNIRDASDNIIYKETAGARSGKGTIYEVATVEPFTGPFGYTEYYKMLWRRAENQTVGD